MHAAICPRMHERTSFPFPPALLIQTGCHFDGRPCSLRGQANRRAALCAAHCFAAGGHRPVAHTLALLVSLIQPRPRIAPACPSACGCRRRRMLRVSGRDPPHPQACNRVPPCLIPCTLGPSLSSCPQQSQPARQMPACLALRTETARQPPGDWLSTCSHIRSRSHTSGQHSIVSPRKIGKECMAHDFTQRQWKGCPELTEGAWRRLVLVGAAGRRPGCGASRPLRGLPKHAPRPAGAHGQTAAPRRQRARGTPSRRLCARQGSVATARASGVSPGAPPVLSRFAHAQG